MLPRPCLPRKQGQKHFPGTACQQSDPAPSTFFSLAAKSFPGISRGQRHYILPFPTDDSDEEDDKIPKEDGWEEGDHDTAPEPEPTYLTISDWQLDKEVEKLEYDMEDVLEDELFVQAAKYRDMLSKLSMDDAATVLRLNYEFYAAFKEKDLSKLKRIWLEDPNTMIVHPFEDPVLGYNAVGRYWRNLFKKKSPKSTSVWKELSVRDFRVVVRGTVAWVCCTEDLTFPPGVQMPQPFQSSTSKKAPGSEMYATNVFLRRNGKWKLALRHVSPDTLDQIKTVPRPTNIAEPKSGIIQGDAGNGPIQISFKDLLGEQADESLADAERMSLQDFLQSLGSQAISVDEIKAELSPDQPNSSDEVTLDEGVNLNENDVVIRLTDDGITVERILKDEPDLSSGKVINLDQHLPDTNGMERDNSEDSADEDIELEKNFFSLFGKLGFKMPPLVGVNGTIIPPETSPKPESNNREMSVTIDFNDEIVPDFNSGEGKSLMRQTIESVQRLKRENRLSAEVKRALIADIIAHAPSEEASMVETAYELLVLQSTNGWGDEKIVEEYATQCEIIAADLDTDTKM